MPWSRVFPLKLTGHQLVTKVPVFYGTWRFINTFKRASHLSLSWDSSIQSMTPSHFLKICLNIILPSMPGSSTWYVPQVSPPKPYIHLPSPTCAYMPHRSYFSWFYHLNIWWVQVMKHVIMQSSKLPCYLVALRSKHFPQYAILSHPQPMFYPHLWDQVSHPHKTGKIIVLYILFFTFLIANWKTIFSTKWWQAFPEFNLLLIFSWMQFRCVGLFPTIWLQQCQLNVLISGPLSKMHITWSHMINQWVRWQTYTTAYLMTFYPLLESTYMKILFSQ